MVGSIIGNRYFDIASLDLFVSDVNRKTEEREGHQPFPVFPSPMSGR